MLVGHIYRDAQLMNNETEKNAHKKHPNQNTKFSEIGVKLHYPRKINGGPFIIRCY